MTDQPHQPTAADASFLPHIVGVLDRAANSTPFPLPLVIGVGDADDDHDFTIAIAPPADDVYDTLIGLVAPPEWLALLVWVEGSAFRPDESGWREPVRLLLALMCDGRALSRLQTLDGEALPFGPDRPSEGLLLDCARRVFGLATPPPPESTCGLHLALWLDAIIALSLAEPGLDLDWQAVAALHPAAPDIVDGQPGSLADAATRLDRAVDWRSLHDAAAAGIRPDLPVTPEEAAWMDAGLFARWCLASLPDPGEANATLADVLRPEVMAAVRHVGQASG